MQTTSTSPADLPLSIAGYFANETTDPEAVAACFTDDAVVVDERSEHHGRSAIAAWNAAANRRFPFTTEVLTADTHGSRTTVLGKVVGGFPGSPISLHFRFPLAGELISRLEIAP